MALTEAQLAALASGRGRRKGRPNKVTQSLKEMILQSLSDVGGAAYLTAQATKQPAAYLALIGRVLPLQVKDGGDEPQVPKPVIHQHVSADQSQNPSEK